MPKTKTTETKAEKEKRAKLRALLKLILFRNILKWFDIAILLYQ